MSKLLTAAEVAERLNLRKGRVYELAKLGTLPCVRIRRQVRFDENQLNAWIANGGHPLPDPDVLNAPAVVHFRR